MSQLWRDTAEEEGEAVREAEEEIKDETSRVNARKVEFRRRQPSSSVDISDCTQEKQKKIKESTNSPFVFEP